MSSPHHGKGRMDKDLTYEEDQKRRLLQVLGPLQCFDVAFALATAPQVLWIFVWLILTHPARKTDVISTTRASPITQRPPSLTAT